MILSPVVWIGEGEEAGKSSKVWEEYSEFPWRIRACSPPGEAQPVGNWVSDPNLAAFYVESSRANLQMLEADADYPFYPSGIEEIPIEPVI
jgi:hypothetical protein